MDTSFLILYDILEMKREERKREREVIMNVVNDVQFAMCKVTY